MKYNPSNYNILMTVESIEPSTGGPARSVPGLSGAVIDAGGGVQLFVNGNCPKTLRCNASETSLVPIQPFSQLEITLQELMSNKTHRPIVHNHGIWLPINHRASEIARRYRIPVIISPRGMLEPWAFNFRKWKKKLAWFLYQQRDLQRASLLHATAPQEAETIRALGLRSPIAIIPNGVRVPQIVKKKSTDSKTKKALFLSRIHRKKGIINLIQAWHKVMPLNWQVIVAGPDEDKHKQEVVLEIERLGLAESFSFVGTVPDEDKWSLYSEADLFIFPTYSENFGIVVAESLASGVPVITTKGTPWAELEQQKCGWWVDIGVEPLAQAISEAISLSPETRFVMGQRGRRLVAEKYSWETIAQDMLSVYDWVLHGGTPPKCVITD